MSLTAMLIEGMIYFDKNRPSFHLLNDNSHNNGHNLELQSARVINEPNVQKGDEPVVLGIAGNDVDER